jgi:hypothetical protein
MYYLPHNNQIDQTSLNDVVDTMPFNSSWAPGGLAGCDMADVGVKAGVGVSQGGLNVNAGGNVSFTWLLISGALAYFMFFRKKG